MGKYIRHAIAMFTAAVVGTVLAWFGLTPDLLTAEQTEAVQTISTAIETLLWIFLTFVVYPMVEKYLKRFRSIDLAGYLDRQRLKREANTGRQL